MRTSLATKTMKSKFSILTTAVAAILLSLPLGTIAKEPEHADAPKVSPADALARLKAGNQRFVAGKLQHPHQDSKRRAELAKGQRPFAIVLGCADSRTSPEVLFDQGLGDLLWFALRAMFSTITPLPALNMRSSTWALSSSSFWAISAAARYRRPRKLSIQTLKRPRTSTRSSPPYSPQWRLLAGRTWKRPSKRT